MAKRNILTLLAGGDRRSTGRADQVAAQVTRDLTLFAELIAGLWAEDPIVRMRAADAAEKITRTHRELLQPYKKELLGLMSEAGQQELRWHLAVMVPRLALTTKERQIVFSALMNYLEDRSSIVKTFALQGLADLAQHDSSIRATVVEILRDGARKGTAAMKARSRKLLVRLENRDDSGSTGPRS
jgi:hypothetical protein